jgi:hypothetical protein
MLARIIIVQILTWNAATDELFTAKQSGKLILNCSRNTRPYAGRMQSPAAIHSVN